MPSQYRVLRVFLLFMVTALMGQKVVAQNCVDNVVLVHGNGSSPSSWDNTVDKLLWSGYQQAQIFTPAWGVSSPARNNHYGREEVPVREAIVAAIETSCTGNIDIIAHSMGVTLAAQQVIKLGADDLVESFVGIAGAYRGVWTCGVYPFNVWTSTCGKWGSSIGSPFLQWLYGKPIAQRVFSMKSWIDQVVCAWGACMVNGRHTSQIEGEQDSYTYYYGHFGLQKYTADDQLMLIY